MRFIFRLSYRKASEGEIDAGDKGIDPADWSKASDSISLGVAMVSEKPGTSQSERSLWVVPSWPSIFDLIQIGFMRWKTILLTVTLFTGGAILLARIIPKTYQSVAVVRTKEAKAINPAERNSRTFQVQERERLILDELRSSLFSYEVVKQAAEEAKLLDKNEVDGSIGILKRAVWRLAGGLFEETPEASERQLFDVIRFRHLSFSRLDARSIEERFVERETNMFKVAMEYSEPQAARVFLQRSLEIYRDSIEKERSEMNAKLAKAYDQLAEMLGEEVKRAEGDPQQARERLQEIDLLREKIQSKMNEEALARNRAQSELAELRKQVADAESRYSGRHPTLQGLREQFAQAAARAQTPVTVIQREIESLRTELSSRFASLIEVSQGTYETKGISGEGHSEQLTKARTSLRTLSGTYQTLQEHYLQMTVQERIGKLLSQQSFEIVEPASFPMRPIRPALTKLLAVGILLGVCFGLVAALAREYLSSRVRVNWILAHRSGLPVLGEQKAFLGDGFVEVSFRDEGKNVQVSDNGPARKIRGKKLALAEKEAKGRGRWKRRDLAFLLTSISNQSRDYPDVFQCGFMALSTKVSSARTVMEIAGELQRVAMTKEDVVIVATARDRGVLSLFGIMESEGQGEIFEIERGLSLIDASNRRLDEELLTTIHSAGYRYVIWDLPDFASLAWKGVDLPRMPIVGLVDLRNLRFDDIRDAAAWLRVLGKHGGFSVGIYVAKGTAAIRPKFLNYIKEKIAI